MRIFEGHDSPFINPYPVQFKTPYDKCCCFCKHCTDIWWDYSNGPYMMLCDEHQDIANKGYNKDGKCPYFEDDYKEPTDEETLKKPLPIGYQIWLFTKGIIYLRNLSRGEKNDSDNV